MWMLVRIPSAKECNNGVNTAWQSLSRLVAASIIITCNELGMVAGQ